MTKKELIKQLKRLPEGEVVVKVENELYYPIKGICLEKIGSNEIILINCRNVKV